MICEEQLLKGGDFLNYLRLKARKKGTPVSAMFELTPRCNFNCKMCYVHLSDDRISSYGRELSGEKWIELAGEARDAGVINLCITGGEAILHPDCKQIYKAVGQMGFIITLQTNLSMIRGDILDLLEEYPPNQIKFSLYGSNNEIYKDVCGIDNGFTKVNACIEEVQKRKIPLLAVTTIIHQNMHDLENIRDYCNKMNIPWIYSAAVKESVRGAKEEVEDVALSEFELTDFRKDVRNMIDNPSVKDGMKPCEVCKDYRTGFWITWDGNMRFCSFMNEPNISVNEYSFKEAWNRLLDYEENLRWPEECYSCEIFNICRKCAGMFNTQTGSPCHVDRHYCEKLKKYVKEELKHKK